jgi:hypothetical protein
MTNSSREKSERLERDIESYTSGEVPSPLSLLQAPTLDRWSTAVRQRGKEFVMVLTGDVYKHPEFQDGDNIHTSAVMWFDRENRFARTVSRLYALGRPAAAKESE